MIMRSGSKQITIRFEAQKMTMRHGQATPNSIQRSIKTPGKPQAMFPQRALLQS
jgi:hypothetical protein